MRDRIAIVHKTVFHGKSRIRGGRPISENMQISVFFPWSAQKAVIVQVYVDDSNSVVILAICYHIHIVVYRSPLFPINID